MPEASGELVKTIASILQWAFIAKYGRAKISQPEVAI